MSVSPSPSSSSSPPPPSSSSSVKAVRDAETTADAPKPWLLISSLLALFLMLFAVDSLRTPLLAWASSSVWAGAGLGALALVVLLYVLSMLYTNEWRGGGASGLYRHSDYADKSAAHVESAISGYEAVCSTTARQGDGSHVAMIEKRKKNYMNMVNHFYDVVTDFYEYGWGDCFHFGFRFKGEGFQESLRRTEYYLALRLGMNQHTQVVDVGCGVGGPMRNIARFTGSRITGINNNSYQIKVGTKHNTRWGLLGQCDFMQSDFMKINVPDNTYDHAYAIEATCHAPDKAACYAEVYRIIKPGGYFAAYDWCVTEKYDANNPVHVSCREGIEVGNGLPVLATTGECLEALTKAGFEVIDSFNAQKDAHAGVQHVPWYQSLAGEYTLNGFRMTPPGRAVTHALVSALEFVRIAPRGSTKVSKLLNDTALDLVNGGKMEIFTPSFFFIARKPL